MSGGLRLPLFWGGKSVIFPVVLNVTWFGERSDGEDEAVRVVAWPGSLRRGSGFFDRSDSNREGLPPHPFPGPDRQSSGIGPGIKGEGVSILLSRHQRHPQ